MKDLLMQKEATNHGSSRKGKGKLWLWAALVALVLTVSFLAVLRRFQKPPDGSAPSQLREAIANPIKFATNRFVGGIGAAISLPPGRGLPQVQSVLRGSPAEAAGLREGDFLIRIGDEPTKGKTVLQIVDLIRGVTLLKTTLEIERYGTIWSAVWGRESWETLKKKAK